MLTLLVMNKTISHHEKQQKKEKTIKLNVMQHLQEMASSFQREQQQTRIQRERHHLEKLAMMEKLIEMLNKRE